MIISSKVGSAMVALAAGLLAGTVGAADAPPAMPGFATPPPVKDDGTITVPSFDLPFSSFASPEATQALVQRLHNPLPMSRDIAKMRQTLDENLVKPQLEKARAAYPTTSAKSIMGGVPVETFLPTAGVAPKNKDRVLISVHGGGFITGGGGPGGALEAIPIGVVGRIKVIAVDYRLQPEHPFPAAVEDTAAVYRELLKTYKPENIGIYGCSAGGILSAQAVAWFLKEKMPVPGAIGVFCASTYGFDLGDSAQLWPRLGSVIPIIPSAKPKFPTDPLQYPSASKDVLKGFPATLFLTGTRAPEMSGATQAHLQLLELGVKSELLLFDGMDHGFYTDVTFPESQRAYKLIAQFFAEHLGTKRSKR
jgi:epsilon-lactone hydrolase